MRKGEGGRDDRSGVKEKRKYGLTDIAYENLGTCGEEFS